MSLSAFRSRCSLSLILLGCLSLAPVTAFADFPDHLLLGHYPGATIRNYQQIDYEKIALPAGLPADADSREFPMQERVGLLTRHFYEVKHVSTLKLYENYSAAVKKLGFNLLYSCKLESCGNEGQAQALGALVSLENSVYNDYLKPYYLLAEGKGKQGPVTLAIFIGGSDDEASVQQTVVEAEPLDIDLIKVNPAYLQHAANTSMPAADPVPAGEDDPLLARYPGATVRQKKQADYETIALPKSSVNDAGQAEMLKLVGDLSRHFYEIKHVSTLKIYENYRSALHKAGFDTLFSCELTACGTEDQAEKLGALVSLEDSVYNDYRKPYYILAQGKGASGPVYVALFIGGYEDEASVQQVILRTTALQTDLVKVDADSLNRDLEATGKALVYGIYFDTDKASIQPKSKPTLDAIAGLLKAHPQLNLYVVGHTDDSGNLDHNLQLSHERASAVVANLVNGYSIAAARLQAEGVGPFAPAASNRNDNGKQLNRRVELVQRLN